MEPENKSSVGSIIGTIVIIAIIVLGGLYFWGKRIEENKSKENLITDFTPGEVENFQAGTSAEVGSSDDLNSIEADLNATDLDSLGAELEQ